MTELDALAGPESLITGTKEDAPEWRAKTLNRFVAAPVSSSAPLHAE